MDARVRILMVREDSLEESGLAMHLARDPAFSLVGQITPAADVLAESRRLDAGLILWDAGVDFASSVERLREIAPLPAPLALIASSERGAPDAYSLGARGFFLRGTDEARLHGGLGAIAQGAVVLDEPVADALFSPPKSARGESPLTARELEVLSLISEGLSNKLIAARLGISENTAKFHVNAILGKLGAETRTEAVVLAARLGFLVL